MPLETIWVFAEAFEGAPLSSTLELLTKAREVGGTVEAFYAGADAEQVAPQLGAYGASKVYTTGDLGGSLLGAPVAAAMAAQLEAGPKPDLIMFAQTYDGRDVVGRLSVRIDQPVLTNGLDLSVDGGITVGTAIFGGNTIVKTAFKGEGPHLACFRPKSFAPEEGGGASPEVVSVSVPDV